MRRVRKEAMWHHRDVDVHGNGSGHSVSKSFFGHIVTQALLFRYMGSAFSASSGSEPPGPQFVYFQETRQSPRHGCSSP